MMQHLHRAVGGRARGGTIACAVLAVGCLALGGVFVRLSEVGPIATGGFRSLIAAPMLFLLDAGVGLRRGAQRQERMPFRDQVTIALGGALLAIDLCLWNVSFFYTTLAESNLLANLVPFAAAIYGWVLFRDAPDVRLVLPAILAIGGLLLLTPVGVHTDPRHLLGNAMALATAFFYTGFLVVAQGLRKRYPALRIMAVLSLWCAAVCLAVAMLRGENLLPRSVTGWLLLAALAHLSDTRADPHGARYALHVAAARVAVRAAPACGSGRLRLHPLRRDSDALPAPWRGDPHRHHLLGQARPRLVTRLRCRIAELTRLRSLQEASLRVQRCLRYRHQGGWYALAHLSRIREGQYVGERPSSSA